jgi:hypothetical protein
MIKRKSLLLLTYFAILLIIGLMQISCSSVISTIVNDNQFSDGDYFFVLYKSNESSISAYGVMSIYYMSYDSTVTGSYVTEYNKNFTFSDNKGGIIGKANWSSGEAKIKLGTSYFSNVEMTLRKDIDVVTGDWTSGYSSGKIYAFKKNK